MEKPGLSIFFPAYNEELNIGKTVAGALAYAAVHWPDHEVIVVDDGSNDRTNEICSELARKNPRLKIVRHPANRGYGAAVRSGLAAASKDLIFFTDGDGQFDISELTAFVPLLDGADLVIGYRLRRRDPLHRLIFARAYHWLINLLFGLWVKDIDCAFKLFRAQAVKGLALKSDGAFLSAELLIQAKKNGLRIRQTGVHHFPRTGGRPTGANPRVVLKAFRELFGRYRELKR